MNIKVKLGSYAAAGIRWAALLLAGAGTILCADASWAGARTATATTLAMTSGGSAVNTVAFGSVVTLTADVTAGATPVTVGQVNFCDAAAAHCEDIHILGTAQLTSNGTATFKFRPGVGNHSYKAVFAGTKNAAGSVSGTLALMVTHTGPYPTAVTITDWSGLPTSAYALTASVGGDGSALPTGTVSFFDTSSGNKALGTVALGVDAQGLVFSNSSTPTTGKYSGAIAAGDFNGDGIADLAVVNGGEPQGSRPRLPTVTILLGNGDGTFAAAARSPTVVENPVSIVVGDFNGDGIPDLAVASCCVELSPGVNGNGVVLVLLGNGDGTFGAAAAVAATGDYPNSIAAADLNGDGILDLAVLNIVGEDVTVLLGNGDGTFTPTATSPASGPNPGSMATGDFNGDGVPDLALTSSVCETGNVCHGSVTVLLGNGDGTFTAAASPAVGNTPDQIVAADFNGDGVPDLAVVNFQSSNVTILLGKGDGTFTAVAASPALAQLRWLGTLAVGDFNGDGICDLAVVDDGGATVLLGNGDGTFRAAASPAISGGPYSIAIGDFNGDGFQDIAAAIRLAPTDGCVPHCVGAVTTLLAEPRTVVSAPAHGITFPVNTGTHQVEASYAGDSNYSASVSGPIGLNSAQIPQATLTSSTQASTYGKAVTLTATVAGGPNAIKPPTGTVVFLNGTTRLGTGKLTGSSPCCTTAEATFSTSELPAGTDFITTSYPGDANYVKAASPAVAVTVGKASLTVGANNLSKVYGAALPTLTYTMSGLVNGETAATATKGTPKLATTATASSPVGSYPITATAGTLQAVNYSVTFVNGTLTVIRATPAITWPPPAAITYGTALSATQLDASASAPGTFTYSPALGALLKAGPQALSVTLTPANEAEYTTAKASVTLTVNRATPLIRWDTPAAITYGTPLSATQLDASSNVAGTLTYTPAVRTVLPVGEQSLSATFHPADAADYNSVTVKSTLVVTDAVLTVSADNASRAYGKPNPAFTYAISGFVNGDTAATSTTGAPALTTTATAKSPVGTYPIAVKDGTLLAVNYVFRFMPGTLTVFNAPGAVTKAATNLTDTAAVLNGSITANDATTTCWFVYGTTKTSLTSTTAKTAGLEGTKPTAVSATLAGLKAGTTYYFQAAASNSDGTTNGASLSFTTQ